MRIVFFFQGEKEGRGGLFLSLPCLHLYGRMIKIECVVYANKEIKEPLKKVILRERLILPPASGTRFCTCKRSRGWKRLGLGLAAALEPPDPGAFCELHCNQVCP